MDMATTFIKQLVFSGIFIVFFAIKSGFAASGDDEFLQARAAYDKKNVIALSDYVEQLQSQNYILAPYADSVSYTHLDVYKRQVLYRLIICIFQIQQHQPIICICLLYTSRCV